MCFLAIRRLVAGPKENWANQKSIPASRLFNSTCACRYLVAVHSVLLVSIFRTFADGEPQQSSSEAAGKTGKRRRRRSKRTPQPPAPHPADSAPANLPFWWPAAFLAGVLSCPLSVLYLGVFGFLLSLGFFFFLVRLLRRPREQHRAEGGGWDGGNKTSEFGELRANSAGMCVGNATSSDSSQLSLRATKSIASACTPAYSPAISLVLSDSMLSAQIKLSDHVQKWRIVLDSRIL